MNSVLSRKMTPSCEWPILQEKNVIISHLTQFSVWFLLATESNLGDREVR